MSEAADVIFEAALLGDRLIVSYMVDAKTEFRRFLLDGTPNGIVALPGVGNAGGGTGKNEGFLVFTSLNVPTTVMRLDVAMNEAAVWAGPMLDHADITVVQRFLAYEDGTRIPIFVVRHKEVTGPAPTMLNAYGGYAIPMIPFYSPATIAWVEQGGVYAMANIRTRHEEAERLRRFHRCRGIPQGRGNHRTGRTRHSRRIQWRVADRRGGDQRSVLFAAALPGG